MRNYILIILSSLSSGACPHNVGNHIFKVTWSFDANFSDGNFLCIQPCWRLFKSSFSASLSFWLASFVIRYSKPSWTVKKTKQEVMREAGTAKSQINRIRKGQVTVFGYRMTREGTTQIHQMFSCSEAFLHNGQSWQSVFPHLYLLCYLPQNSFLVFWIWPVRNIFSNTFYCFYFCITNTSNVWSLFEYAEFEVLRQSWVDLHMLLNLMHI